MVQQGGAVTFTGPLTIYGNTATGGVGGLGSVGFSPFNPGTPGQDGGNGSAFGSGIFLQGSDSMDGGGGSLIFSPGDGQSQSISDLADQTGSGGTGANAGAWGIIKNGAGSLALTGVNTYSGPTVVNAGILYVDAPLMNSAVTVAAGGTLVGGLPSDVIKSVTVQAGGNVTGSPTIANSATFNSGAIFSVLILGGPGGYPLTAGSIDLTGGPTLNLTLMSFATVGGVYTIMSGRVTGTFNGLPDGAVFARGGSYFRIHYGSSVTLTCLIPPPSITSSRNASGTYGSTFSYAIAATESPANYSITGALPAGLTFNTATGVITGTATQPGIFNLTIGATNGTGTGTAPLAITIAKAPLTVAANYATATAGGPLPPLTASITGFVNGDGPSVVSGAPVLTTTATAMSPPGNYPITVSAGTLAAANYSFTPVAGTLVLTATPTLGLNAGGNTPAPANTILGQSFTMPPNATPWTGITFNFFSDQGLTPVASGKAYLFSMPYTGTPGGLAGLTNPAGASASAMAKAKSRAKKGGARDAAAGFVAVSTGISGGAYVFPPSMVLQPGATYYIYVDTAAGGFPGGIATGGSVAGGVGFAAGGAAGTFAPMAGSANFRVNGVAVPPASSVAVTSSVNPSALGQMVTFTALVSGNLAGIPAGSVQFLDGTTALGSAALSGGQATFRTAALTAGSHVIVASYGGGGGLPASQGTMVQNVNALPSTMTLAANPAAPVYGQAVTVTANVAGTAAPAGIAGPTGMVTFYVDATPFARTAAGTASLASGAASVALNGLAAGTHTVLAQYSGDANWAASAAQTALTVAQAATATSVSLAVTGGQLVATSAVAAAAGAGTPTGTVTFVDTANNAMLASAGLAGGNASAQLAASAAGRPIAAVYAGDANFKGSTSAALPAVTNAASSGGAGFAADEMCSLMGVAGLSGDTAGTLPLASSLAGVTVRITDSAGVARNAPLYGVFGSAGQINFAIPGDTAKGMAAVTVGLPGGGAIATAVGIGAMAPGIFSADATGHGVWAGQAIHVHADGSQTAVASARWDDGSRQWIANPIGLGPDGERVILVIYGTGLRHGSTLAVTAGGTALPVLYWGAQGQYPGLDQVNVELPRGLAGAGAVDLVVSVDGRAANTVTAMVQ